MTTQSKQRLGLGTAVAAGAAMALMRVISAATTFWYGLVTLLLVAVFACAVAAFVIPITHYAWNYWSAFAASLQSPAPAKAARK